MKTPIADRLRAVATGVALTTLTLPSGCAVQADEGTDTVARHDRPSETRTPIKHVVVVVGENHSFDNLFGTYKPKRGQHVANLLSKGIVNEDGSPGRHFDRGRQMIGSSTDRLSLR